MIGLLDYDWFYPKYRDKLIPNLEIMKLATYYHIEEKKFCRLLSLNEKELTQYSNIYFFSELGSNIQIPPQFLQCNNVTYGGSALTREKYIPFSNSIIDFTIPKPSIYKEFLKQKYQDGAKAKIIAHVLDDSYYRMYASDSILPIPPIIPRKRVFIYDRDFFKPKWQEIIEEISDRKPSSIIPIHIVYCKKLTDYISFRNQRLIARNADIILDLNIPLEEVHYLFKTYKNFFLADINNTSQVYLELGGSFQAKRQYLNDFIYKMNLLYSFWSNGIPIKVKYKETDLISINPLKNLEQIIENWTNNSKEEKTLEERISFRINKDLKKVIKEEKEELFQYSPDARELFKYNYIMLKQQKIWRV